VEVRREGEAAWRDVVQLSGYNVTSGELKVATASHGRYTLEARAAGGDGGVDSTPWTHVWHVDTSPPTVSFASTPSEWSDEPRGNVLLIMRSSEDLTAFECRLRSGSLCLSTTGSLVSSNASSTSSCPWQRQTAADINVTGLFAAAVYDIDVRGVDAAGNVGDAVSWQWSSGGCPASVPIVVSSVESVPLQLGRRSIVWQSYATGAVAWNGSFGFECRHVLDASASGWGWNVCGDSASESLAGGGEVWRIHARPGAWHTVDVRVAVPSGCGKSVEVQPHRSVRWFEHAAAPGDAAFVSTPSATSSLVVATFVMNSTAHPLESWFQYSLDGSVWSGCDSTLRVGPLSQGPHILEVRTVSSAGVVGGTTARHAWLVSTSGTSLLLPDMADGPHSLSIWAQDSRGRLQRSPTVVSWVVDTVAPSTRLALSCGGATLAPGIETREAECIVSGACADASTGGVDTSPCSVCWLVLGGDGASGLSETCNGAGNVNTTVTVRRIVDGGVVVLGFAIDGAGNRDAVGANVSWAWDTSPPDTLAVLLEVSNTSISTAWLPWANATALNSTMLPLLVSSSESVSQFVVDVDGDGVGVVALLPRWSNGSLSMLQVVGVPSGLHTVLVAAVDAAGNVDATPANVTVFVDTMPPSTEVVSQPPAAVNASSVSIGVRSRDEASGLLLGFRVECVPALPSLPSFVAVQGEMSVMATVSASAMGDGSYSIRLRAVNVLGVVDRVGAVVSVTVDTTPPTCSIVAPPPFVASRSVHLSWAASDALSPVSVSYRHVNHSVDWTSLTPVGASVGTTGGNFSSHDLAEGLQLWLLTCRDAAGNTVASPIVASTIVDVTPPVVTWVSVPPVYVNTSEVTVCVAVVDASPWSVNVSGVASSGQGGSSVPAPVVLSMSSPSASRVCWVLSLPWRGMYDVVATAEDSASNVGVSVAQQVAFDDLPPTQTLALVDVDSGGTRLCVGGAATVCNASLVSVACSNGGGSDGGGAGVVGVQSPCSVQYQLHLLSLIRVSQSSCSDASNSSGTQAPGTSTLTVSSWTPLSLSTAVWSPPVTSDGFYVLFVRAVDGAGNVGGVSNVSWWLDSTPPSSPPVMTRTPDAVTLSRDALFELQGVDDGSPGQLSFRYRWFSGGVLKSNSGVGDGFVPVPALPSTPTSVVQLRLIDGAVDSSHLIEVASVDALGRASALSTSFGWRVLAAAPVVAVLSQPANVSGNATATFVMAAAWKNGASRSDDASASAFQVMLLNGGGDAGQWHDPCRFAERARECAAACSGARCVYSLKLGGAGAYTLQMRAVLLNTTGDVSVVSWTYIRCSDSEFAVLSGVGGDAIECKACPSGGNCSRASPSDVVTQANIVARVGYWASPSSDGSRFYRCPILGACVGGGNGSRAACATGYDHVACSLCADGYFEQFGLCVPCPKSKSGSVGAVVGLSLMLIALCGGLYVVRNVLPIDVIKLGVSMMQIIASANSAYDIPWPSTFRRFLSLLRVFLVDVVAITQASCAQPMDYFTNMMVVCVGLKLALALLLLGPWAWSKLAARDCRFTRAVREVQVRRKVSAVEVSMAAAGRRRSSVAKGMAAALAAAQRDATTINWKAVFKASFMLLFIAYPGVSLKVLRLFKCRQIEGVWWLAADMRLRCYDGRWAGFAVYGLVMAVVYVTGLPVAVLWILWRRRHKLFGSPSDPFVESTRAALGFLYVAYGDSAWWWEVEELVRKLLLSAVVVLIEEGSPLQVTLAVLVSGWAHVLHAMYKPWGAGSVLYSLQHGALFVTSFVFLMGLLFKVDGVSSSSGTYSALSGIMVMLCTAFMAAWVVVIVRGVTAMWRASRSGRSGRPNALSSGPERVGAGDALVADSGSRDVAADAVGALSSGALSRFMVSNPLQHSLRGMTRAGAPTAQARSSSAIPVSRPQRVLAAQQPVLSTRTIGTF
jgi:hypothetical protein